MVVLPQLQKRGGTFNPFELLLSDEYIKLLKVLKANLVSCADIFSIETGVSICYC